MSIKYAFRIYCVIIDFQGYFMSQTFFPRIFLLIRGQNLDIAVNFQVNSTKSSYICVKKTESALT